MHGQTYSGSPDDEDYQTAVERAGVIELPDTASSSRSLPAEVAGGRWEDSEPPVVSR